MSGYIESVERGQAALFPDKLKDWIYGGNLVHVTALSIEQIDLEQMWFR
ncbi:hypothetical protein GCM10007385_31620 [Tateyamaria omphalii]|nr:hypothetical protein [Tateyamaria omphalii]GGX60048.1 hypothetical protein GCM10007385_31620 [Tateyamaria omphalii]